MIELRIVMIKHNLYNNHLWTYHSGNNLRQCLIKWEDTGTKMNTISEQMIQNSYEET